MQAEDKGKTVHASQFEGAERIMAVAAVYSNEVNIMTSPNLTRLTFGEAVPPGPGQTKKTFFHTGILMSTQDAIEMAFTVLRVNGIVPKLPEHRKN